MSFHEVLDSICKIFIERLENVDWFHGMSTLVGLFNAEAIISYLPTPPLGQDMTQGQFFKRSLTGLNSEFSFS